MLRNYILIIINLFFSFIGYTQNGYFMTDSATNVGFELINERSLNATKCSVFMEGKIVNYTPYQIIEYGFTNGQVYKSFDVVIDGKKERYFLERVLTGTYEIYILKLPSTGRRYYIYDNNKDQLLSTELDQKQLQQLVKPFTKNCSSASRNLKFLKPQGHSLIQYFKYLNSCTSTPYPQIQYGLKIGIAGTNFAPIDPSNFYAKPNYNLDISLTLGAYIDLPIRSSKLSFSPEIYYKKNHYSVSFSKIQEHFDLVMNFSSFNFPMLFKFKFLRKTGFPYLQAGPVYSILSNTKATLYQYQKINNDIYINISDLQIFQKNMGGYSIGGGFIFDAIKNTKWFSEIRYSHLYNLNPNDRSYNLGEISINTGIIF